MVAVVVRGAPAGNFGSDGATDLEEAFVRAAEPVSRDMISLRHYGVSQRTDREPAGSPRLFSAFFFGVLLAPAIFGLEPHCLPARVHSQDKPLLLTVAGERYAPNLLSFLRENGVETNANAHVAEQAMKQFGRQSRRFLLIDSGELRQDRLSDRRARAARSDRRPRQQTSPR